MFATFLKPLWISKISAIFVLETLYKSC